MKRLFTTFTLFLLGMSTAFACRCKVDDAKLLYFLDAKYVFRADVEAASDCGENNKYEYELEVEEVYKGELEEEIKVYTDCITSCAFQLEVGKTYIFFTDLINNNIGFCEYRLTKADADYKNTKKFLKKIKNTRLDYLVINDKEGNKIGEIQIQDGKVNGLAKVYYPDGTLRKRGMYIKGVPSGGFEINEVRANSKERWTGDYENGQRVRMWIHITEQADSLAYEHVFYEDGEIVDRHLMDADSQIKRYSPKSKKD